MAEDRKGREPALAEVQRAFVSKSSPTAGRNGAGYLPCQGLYVHSTGSAPRTALIATHYNVDFSEHYLAEGMAKRGFGFLGWNTRFRGAEAYFLLDHALVDIGVGVRWLREEAGIERVVLLGNSGGGSLFSFYQGQAKAAPAQRIMKTPGGRRTLLEKADLQALISEAEDVD